MTTEGIQNRFSRAEIAEALEISGNQILQYQDRGLLADRSAHAQDVAYNSLDIARLRFILRCEAAGYQGNDVVDFIGTINKGANIKEQLKASLVHAHQKFSYVNAQKRKADILEKVNLQADADLIQKYIDEMKGIVANPEQASIPISPIKQKRTKPPTEEQAAFNINRDSEQPTRYQPEIGMDRPSRLKVGLELSQQRLKSEPKPQPPEPRVRTAPSSVPHRPPPHKNRSKFIDSNSVDYEQRSDSPPDMFIDYSRPRRKKPATAWKQTLVTFLLLSAISLAGYAFYVLKYQTPSNKFMDLNEETIVSESDIDNNSDSGAFKETEQPLEENKIDDAGTASKATSQEEPTKPVIEEKKPEQPKITPKPDVKTDTTPQESQSTKPPKPTASLDSREEPPPATVKEQAPPEPKSYPTQTESRYNDLSEVAPKDIDDLIAQKQRGTQTTADVYASSDRPQVAVYDFKIFYQRSRKILIAKFKMARIRPQRDLIQGRLFVLFKPRISSQNSKFFAVPDTTIVDGIPTEPFKGIEFAFTESTKVQSVRTIYVRDPSQFDIATVFVFSKAGELVLRKDFSVNITEY